MKKNEIKKGMKVWCWWKSRWLYYTGYEGMETGYNTEIKDYTPRHYCKFRDIDGAITRVYDRELEQLRSTAK